MDVQTIIANAKARLSAADTHLANGQEQPAKTELQLMAADVALALREPGEAPSDAPPTDGDKPSTPSSTGPES